MDISNSEIVLHQIRTAFISRRIASASKLPKQRVEKVYLAVLLHDIGALSLEEKIQLHS
ncbi:MAG: HDOD domain-containing protein [Cytophagales bacterium]|nr:HDOD domain-containing protein [Cytophagales bacterium]